MKPRATRVLPLAFLALGACSSAEAGKARSPARPQTTDAGAGGAQAATGGNTGSGGHIGSGGASSNGGAPSSAGSGGSTGGASNAAGRDSGTEDAGLLELPDTTGPDGGDAGGGTSADAAGDGPDIGGICKRRADGIYCGSNLPAPAEPDTRYFCDNGGLFASAECAGGCEASSNACEGGPGSTIGSNDANGGVGSTACRSCATSNCIGFYAGCAADRDCDAEWDCFRTCDATQACVDDCQLMFGHDTTTQDLFGCLEQHCPVVCRLLK